MSARLRVCLIALALVITGCLARPPLGAPIAEPSPTASAQATATPRPPNAANDLLYVRQYPGGGATSVIAIVDARTGAITSTLPDGALSLDRKLVYSTESTDGATRTTVHVRELETGREMRAFSLPGDLYVATGEDGSPAGVTADGQRLILRKLPGQIDGKWVNAIVVVDTTTGTMVGRIDLAATTNYAFVALVDAHVALLNEFGSGTTRVRAFDMAAQAFLPDPALSGWDGRYQTGYRTPFTVSRDGRWLYAVDTGAAEPGAGAFVPFVLAIDTSARKATKIALPAEQRSTDVEKYLLWTLALSPDGGTLYASNAALGAIDEIDTRQVALRRSQRLSRVEPAADPLAALRQVLFPVADAKRYLRGAVVVSPDGRSLYTVGAKGIVAIDTASLSTRDRWLGDTVFDGLAITPDGARLYAIHDDGRRISIMETRSGTCLSACQPSAGELQLFGSLMSVVRIDLR